MGKKFTLGWPLALATILALGYSFVLFVAVSWFESLIKTEPIDSGGFECDESLIILGDGTPLIRREARSGDMAKIASPYMITTNNNGIYSAQSLYSLDGKPIAWEKSKSLFQGGTESLAFSRRKPGPLWSPEMPLAPDKRVLNLLGNERYWTGEKGRVWYFVHDGHLEGKGYFVGYDLETKHCVGYVGQKGMVKEVPPQEDFFPFDGRAMVGDIAGRSNLIYGDLVQIGNPRDLYNQLHRNEVLLVLDDEVLDLDLDGGKIEPILKAPNLISGGVIWWKDRRPVQEGEENMWPKHYLVFWSTDHIYLLDSEKKLINEFVIPESLRELDIYIGLAEGDPQQLLLYTTVEREKILREDLDWVDTEGKILRHEEITFFQNRPENRPVHKPECDWETAFSFPSPLGLVFAMPVYQYDSIDYDNWEFYQSNFEDNWPAMLLFSLLAAGLGYVCYRRQRRYALPWTWVWVVFVFLFGVPGYLGYRFHRRWPVLDACPSCNEKVPHDREVCSSCGASFPRPEPKGIEVFV